MVELVPVHQGVERARAGLILVQHVAPALAAPGRVSASCRLPQRLLNAPFYAVGSTI